MSARLRLGLIAALSALDLAAQFLQMRLYSIPFWFHLVYVIMTMGLLGLAAGGAFLSMFPALMKVHERRCAGACFLGFAAALAAGTWSVTRLSVDFFSLTATRWDLARLGVSCALAMLPHFFFGLWISSSFQREPRQAGSAYCANLLGSALGGLLFLTGIQWLSAPRLLAAFSAAAALPALWLLARGAVPRLAGAGLAAVLLTPVATMEAVFEVNKQFEAALPARRTDFSRWGPISRIDVISARGGADAKFILIDGDAQATMYRLDPAVLAERPPRPERWPMDVDLRAFQFKVLGPALKKALVIGSGGGADVMAALSSGAEAVDAVEINPLTFRLVQEEFSGFLGGLFRDPRVRLHLEDGRSFTRRSLRRYDSITMVGVDSLAALSQGAYVLSENYLYTTDAFSDYFNHLSDAGMIGISRFFFPHGPREDLRLFTQAHAMLTREGIPRPFRHLMAVSQRGRPSIVTLISKSAFTPEQLARAKRWMTRYGLYFVFEPPLAKSPPLGHPAYLRFWKSAQEGSLEAFYREYPFNVAPTTDDRPFFFQYCRWFSPAEPLFKDVPYFSSIIGRWPNIVLMAILAQTAVLLCFLIGLPAALLIRRVRGSGKDGARIMTYFGALGLAYMFVELPVIQRQVLYLGHPIYSMAVSIPALLLASGLGSFASRRRPALGRGLFFVPAVAALCGSFLMSAAFARTILGFSLAGRILCCSLALLPLGFVMGIPFPAGIRRLAAEPDWIAVAWAVNGGLSVFGSILAIVLAMAFGFKLVLAAAVGLYALAAAVAALDWGEPG